jgi:YfiH family protein
VTDPTLRLPILRVSDWAGIPHLVHGFCGRQGGVSRGDFAELNMSRHVGDHPAAVQENWRRVDGAIGGRVRFVIMTQVHGAHVTAVEPGMAEAVEADALVTRATGLALCILTADCVPILLVAPQHTVVGAVHAGWRGTVAGVAARTVRHLKDVLNVEPAALHAALGPAIGSCCYEVDRHIVDELERQWGAMPDAVCRDPHGPKARLDLRRANAVILASAGVPTTRISTTGPCTRCAATAYFSYRAATATAGRTAGNGATGRQLSFIGWQNS